jgi:hypothetical protein
MTGGRTRYKAEQWRRPASDCQRSPGVSTKCLLDKIAVPTSVNDKYNHCPMLSVYFYYLYMIINKR